MCVFPTRPLRCAMWDLTFRTTGRALRLPMSGASSRALRSAPTRPGSTGGALIDGTYVLTAVGYYYGSAFGDGGGGTPTNSLQTETLIIQGNLIALVGAQGTVGTGVAQGGTQQTFAFTTRSRDCPTCVDAGVQEITLTGICGTSSTKGFLYTSQVDSADHVNLRLHALWPDGGVSLEVRSYVQSKP